MEGKKSSFLNSSCMTLFVSTNCEKGNSFDNLQANCRDDHAIITLNFNDNLKKHRAKNPKTQQFIMMSSVYAQLLVVICVVFYICEIVSPKVPLLYFQGFYLFLYSVSLIFLLYIYLYLLHFPRSPPSNPPNKSSGKKVIILESLRKGDDKPPTAEVGNETPRTQRAKKQRVSENDKSHGSLFLRIGAIAFGLGTMVYNGLEFGSFFEIPSSSACYSVIVGVNPILQMVFTFVQMYFIFVNSRLNIHKCKVLARFGLMHIVATNICVWIRTVGKESLHAIVEHHMETGTGSTLEDLLLPLRENFTGNHSNPCQKQNIMGPVVNSSSAFLYPFIVEYSLIGAAVLYVMWENIGKNPVYSNPPSGNEDGMSHTSTSRNDRVNCAGSSKGLFLGLLLLVTAIIFLIVFFVLIHHEKHKLLAVYLSELSHISLMILTIIAIIIGFFRIKLLRFHSECTDHQRDILLRVAAFGLYAYSMFGIIAGTFSSKSYTPNVLVLVTSCLTILQVAMQSFFLADVTCRTSSLPEHDRAKPGRQIVTFLMIANLIMWIIYTFEMQKVEASPVQMEFFGFLAWTVIVRITLPLSIFYRFHSFITFAEVWKNSYKNVAS
ncbi:proton channel OtopLc-like [Centruroides vittatus]|uniref:proton channel OtopLc-like n=1 Tax=Centruroides vittatus TaxID=120091 RepID=UPI003510083A